LIKNALCGPTILSEQELAERVSTYAKICQHIFSGEKSRTLLIFAANKPAIPAKKIPWEKPRSAEIFLAHDAGNHAVVVEAGR
jgi:hypothetical protein